MQHGGSAETGSGPCPKKKDTSQFAFVPQQHTRHPTTKHTRRLLQPAVGKGGFVTPHTRGLLGRPLLTGCVRTAAACLYLCRCCCCGCCSHHSPPLDHWLRLLLLLGVSITRADGRGWLPSLSLRSQGCLLLLPPQPCVLDHSSALLRFLHALGGLSGGASWSTELRAQPQGRRASTTPQPAPNTIRTRDSNPQRHAPDKHDRGAGQSTDFTPRPLSCSVDDLLFLSEAGKTHLGQA